MIIPWINKPESMWHLTVKQPDVTVLIYSASLADFR
jgi:hypothetical protein